MQLFEYLNGYYMRIERIGEAYVEFHLKYEPQLRVFTPRSSPTRILNYIKQPKFAGVVE